LAQGQSCFAITLQREKGGLDLTRHLTPTLSPNSVGGEGESFAVLNEKLHLDLLDSP
jgi:hypothetical protein